MYINPYVIGIDCHLAQMEGATPRAIITTLGYNTGNMVFSEALYRCLVGARRGSYTFAKESLEGHDSVVIAASNWLNPDDDLSDLLEKLEHSHLPVIIVGLGSQMPSGKEIPKLKPSTLRLLEVISERSSMISVRGAFSAEILERYGINNVMITGCPSLLLCGSRGPNIRAVGNGDMGRCVVSSTRHLMERADEFQLYLYRQAMKNDYYLVLQSELADYCLMCDDRGLEGNSSEVLKEAYGVTDLADIKRYLQKRGRIFLSLEEWIHFASAQSFCVGTRLHGAVVSLISGTPATLIVHDARTQESALSMNIPHVNMSEIDTSRDISVEMLYNSEKMLAFVDGYRVYRDNFELFFLKNCLGLVEGNASSVQRLESPTDGSIEVVGDNRDMNMQNLPETLDAIGIRHGTDKASTHNNFLGFYSGFLESRRWEAMKVLEVGVLGGASVRTWRDYFPNGEIIGVDVNPEATKVADERIRIEVADQSNSTDLDRIARLGPFDLVVDDGSHVWSNQILTFKILIAAVKPGGTYILEDLDTSYGRYIRDYRGVGGQTAAEYLQRLSDWVVGCRVLNLTEQHDRSIQLIWPTIESVTFARGTALIRKRLVYDAIAAAMVKQNQESSGRASEG